MSDYQVLSVAHRDIVEVWEHVAVDSEATADRVIDEIYACFAQLALMPRAGFQRQDWTVEPVRFWVVRKYIVTYLPETRPVQIIGVLHGARDIPNLLPRRFP